MENCSRNCAEFPIRFRKRLTIKSGYSGLQVNMRMQKMYFLSGAASIMQSVWKEASRELKHGTISLIEDGILVVGVLTQNDLFEKTLSNMVEVKSRGAYLMGLTTYGNYSVEDTADFSVYVPKTEEYFSASLAIVPLQLMGYYVSVAKGLDVDKPRNLAKSIFSLFNIFIRENMHFVFENIHFGELTRNRC